MSNDYQTPDGPKRRRPVTRADSQEASGSPSKKKRSVILLIVSIVLFCAGVGFLCYPMVLKYISSNAMRSAVQDINRFDNAVYKPVDPNSLTEPEIKNIPPDNLVDIPEVNLNFSFEGAAEEAGFALEIPSIDLLVGAFPSESIEQMYPNMRKGAALYPMSDEPGTLGNTSMAAHRTGPSDFFFSLDDVQIGEYLFLHMRNGLSYRYVVESVFIAEKGDWGVIDRPGYAAVTLTTCQEEGGISNAKRLVLRGKLDAVAVQVKE